MRPIQTSEQSSDLGVCARKWNPPPSENGTSQHPPINAEVRAGREQATRTAPFAGHALTALSWWPSTGPAHGSEAEMPRSEP